MPSLVETLRASEVFGEVPRELLDRVAGRIEAEQVPRRAFLFHEGDPARWLWVVESGRVKIFKTSASGREQILAVEEPGSSFAELPVFDGNGAPAWALSLTGVETRFKPERRRELGDLLLHQAHLLSGALQT